MSNDGKGQLAKKIDVAAERYGQFQVARPLIQLIPFGVGSAIDSLFGNRAAEVQTSRFTMLIEDLKSAVEQLDETKIDKDYLKSDDFYFLCRDLFSKVINEREEEKLELFRNIFLGAIIFNRPDKVFVEICTSLLSELTTVDVQVLQKTKEYNYLREDGAHYKFKISDADEGSVSYEGNSPEELGLPEADLLLASGLKLRRLALIDRFSRLSALGESFIRFVLHKTEG